MTALAAASVHAQANGDELARAAPQEIQRKVETVRCCIKDPACPETLEADCLAPKADAQPASRPLASVVPVLPPAQYNAADVRPVFEQGSLGDKLLFLATRPQVTHVMIVQPYGFSVTTGGDGTPDTLCHAVVVEQMKGPPLLGVEFVTSGGPAPGAARASHAPKCELGVQQLVLLGKPAGWASLVAVGSDETEVVAKNDEGRALLSAAVPVLRNALGRTP